MLGAIFVELFVTLLRGNLMARRIAAMILDWIPVTILAAILQTLILGSPNALVLNGSFATAFTPVVFLAALGYFTLMEGYLGWTFGKLIVGLRVTNEDGEAPGLQGAFVRSTLRAVDGISGYIVGFVAALLSERRQRIGDRLAGTFVVAAPAAALAGGDPAAEGYGDAAFGGGGPALPHYTKNLTKEAKRGKIDPVVGREAEVKQVVRVLGRTKKNNPVLVGEAGVGKTAIAEGLARIAAGLEGDPPPELKGKRILELDLTAIDSGTIYRGMFEERMQRVIREASRPDVILFVDELHRLMGLGSSAEAEKSPGAQMLKPALARGEVTVIGATTPDEYREIEKDPALARRFQPVQVGPLSTEATTEVLHKLGPKWEAGGVVSIDEEALSVAASWAERNLRGHLPDSAISLVDDAVSGKKSEGGGVVTKEDLAAVIEEQTGIKTQASAGELARLRGLEDELKRRVVGQDHAVEVVAKTIRRRTALGEERPASLLFLGPSGVGKTELAKALAEALFGDERAMIRLNMSEFSREGSEWRLIGSPKGHKESESGGQLTEEVRRRPYSVVLLDEIEKAHPQIHTLLLQLLDEGTLSDGLGREVDFTHAIIVMTSNVGAARILAGDTGADGAVDDLIRAGFPPEVVGRMDEKVVFRPLGEEALEGIVRLLVKKPLARVEERQGVEVAVDESLIRSIARAGRDPRLGARELRSEVRSRVEDRITELVVDGALGGGSGKVVLYHDEETGEDQVLGADDHPKATTAGG